MIGRRYLVDNNALAKLSRTQRGSEYFLTNCRIPTEVLHEARGLPDVAELKSIEFPTTGAILALLKEVMATVGTDDIKLVNLYANTGNGDPLLIACALAGVREADEGLFGLEWAIVTDDNAVRAKAAEFNIATLTSAELSTVLDSEV